jgi:hypothetical protein
MAITAVNPFDNNLATMATNMQNGRFQQVLGVTIFKQVIDSEKAQAEALLQMMTSTPTPTLEGTGQIVNTGA